MPACIPVFLEPHTSAPTAHCSLPMLTCPRDEVGPFSRWCFSELATLHRSLRVSVRCGGMQRSWQRTRLSPQVSSLIFSGSSGTEYWHANVLLPSLSPPLPATRPAGMLNDMRTSPLFRIALTRLGRPAGVSKKLGTTSSMGAPRFKIKCPHGTVLIDRPGGGILVCGAKSKPAKNNGTAFEEPPFCRRRSSSVHHKQTRKAGFAVRVIFSAQKGRGHFRFLVFTANFFLRHSVLITF